MGRCDFCGAEEAMVFRCKYCGGAYCSTHRLPENHDCHGILKDKLKTVITAQKPTKVDDVEPIATKGTSNTIIYIALLLCLLGSGLSWNHSNIQGYSIGYEMGIDEGKSDGYERGYQDGYEKGVIAGKGNGTIEGYERGFENGRYSGKENGYQEGHNIGYTQGYKEGNQTAFEATYRQGLNDIENHAFNLREPTYSEAIKFLSKDRTDSIQYLLGSFTCDEYSRTVKTNAFLQGIHCYYVSIDFAEPPGHAIVAFNTTDRGLVFFEPQNDRQMDVKIGLHYWRDNGNYLTDHDDTIVSFELVW